MADQFSGLDTCAIHTHKIVHTCDLQHACRFAHGKDCRGSRLMSKIIRQSKTTKEAGFGRSGRERVKTN